MLYKENPSKNNKFGLFRWGKVVLFACLIANTISMYHMMLVANSKPDKGIMVYINNYGEGIFEVIGMTIIVIASLIYFTIFLLKERKAYAAQIN